MSEHSHGPGHETQDFTFERVLWLIPISAVILIVYVITVWFGATAALTHEMARKQSMGAEPMMEPLKKFRAQEDESMHQYKWMNKEKGVVEIPIDRAMELMAQEAAHPDTAKKAKGK